MRMFLDGSERESNRIALIRENRQFHRWEDHLSAEARGGLPTPCRVCLHRNHVPLSIQMLRTMTATSSYVKVACGATNASVRLR